MISTPNIKEKLYLHPFFVREFELLCGIFAFRRLGEPGYTHLVRPCCVHGNETIVRIGGNETQVKGFGKKLFIFTLALFLQYDFTLTVTLEIKTKLLFKWNCFSQLQFLFFQFSICNFRKVENCQVGQ